MALQALGYVFPFATLIIVSRFLPSAGLAEFLYLQAAAAFLAIPVEYGYHLSAVRLMTAAIATKTQCQAVSEVHATRLLLWALAVCGGAVLLANNDVTELSTVSLLALAAAIFSYGFRPLWYYQATDKYRSAVIGELVGTLASFTAVVLASWWRLEPQAIVAAWALPRALATMGLIVRIHMNHGWCSVSPSQLLGSLHRSFLLFVHKLAAGCVHLATPVLLGYLVTKSSLLDFQKAERLVTATQSLLLVISQVGYARVLRRLSDKGDPSKDAWLITTFQLAAATVCSAALYAFAPLLLRLFWGTQTPGSLEALQWMCWLLPILALNGALGLNFLLPRHRDRLVVISAVAGAATTLALLQILAPSLQSLGGVVSIGLGELVMTALMVLGLKYTAGMAVRPN